MKHRLASGENVESQAASSIRGHLSDVELTIIALDNLVTEDPVIDGEALLRKESGIVCVPGIAVVHGVQGLKYCLFSHFQLFGFVELGGVL